MSVAYNDDIVLLISLWRRFDAIRKSKSKIGAIASLVWECVSTPQFAASVPGSNLGRFITGVGSIMSRSDTSSVDEDVERAIPSTQEGGYMLLHQLREQVLEYQLIYGNNDDVEYILQALDTRLNREPNREICVSSVLIPTTRGILLEDYGCHLMSFTPLYKSVFVLFLRHPEGIVLKQREAYYDELVGIYKSYNTKTDETVVEDDIRIRKSCKALLDPSDNAMDSVISKINGIFQHNLASDVAEYYQILGKRGGEKRVKLDQSLIKIPSIVQKIPKTKIT